MEHCVQRIVTSFSYIGLVPIETIQWPTVYGPKTLLELESFLRIFQTFMTLNIRNTPDEQMSNSILSSF